MIRKLFSGLLLSGLLLGNFTYAQQGLDNNQADFGEFMDRKGTYTRTASGKPSENYWQNKADYQIEATLDENAHVLTGKITINYTNNSPENLDFVWLQLEQNRFTPDSRGTLTTPVQGNRYNGDTDGGFDISAVQAKVGSKGSISSKHIITDTRMQVWFNEPIPAKGGKASISMNFSFKVP
ncbi:MAG TPA: peptidase M1, partial [Algoriphagus sp.]|nr:peptidase M1 [Algoriphagus sp.]